MRKSQWRRVIGDCSIAATILSGEGGAFLDSMWLGRARLKDSAGVESGSIGKAAGRFES
jgi:hypothetical protein